MALCSYLGWRFYDAPTATTASRETNSGVQKSGAVPVTSVQALKADFPVYLNGLGSVEPYETVTVRSRVDGEITKIAFRQGQIVKDGDVLVQIDPRPYQAALEQALSKKAQDEATLKNAELNLQRYRTLAAKDFSTKQQLDN
jgi:membrane fusion protein, multidrug efflux system